MIRLALLGLSVLGLLPLQQQQPPPAYEKRDRHDPNGINKWYLGREIAHVMGPGGIPWLDRPERESEENPTKCIESLRLKEGDVVADLGAGSGYYTFRMAPLVGRKGKILAVEIQDEMIAELGKRIVQQKVPNVEVVKCTESDPKLPEAGVDLVIMVDVYHELAFPYEVMSVVRKSLKPGGRVVLVEYRKEDRAVPIKEVHKMSEEQIQKEMAVVGLSHLETIGILPWQHIAVYTNRDLAAETGIELGYKFAVPDDRKAEAGKLAREVETVIRKAFAGDAINSYRLRWQENVLMIRLPAATPESALKVKQLAKTVVQPVPLELASEQLYGPKK